MGRVCWLLALVLLLGAGCKVEDAPERLEQLMVFGFQHFEDHRAQQVEIRETLEPEVELDWDELNQGFRIDTLSAEDLEDAGIEGADVSHIIGAVGGGQYRYPLQEVLEAITEPAREQHYDHVVGWELLEQSGYACFLEDRCQRYRWRARETVKAGILGEVTHTFDGVLRRFEDDQGEPFAVGRILSPERAEMTTNVVKLHQQFSYFVLYPHEGVTRRVEAFWIEAEVIGIDIPDAFAVDQFAAGVARQIERVDAYLDARASL